MRHHNFPTAEFLRIKPFPLFHFPQIQLCNPMREEAHLSVGTRILSGGLGRIRHQYIGMRDIGKGAAGMYTGPVNYSFIRILPG